MKYKNAVSFFQIEGATYFWHLYHSANNLAFQKRMLQTYIHQTDIYSSDRHIFIRQTYIHQTDIYSSDRHIFIRQTYISHHYFRISIN
ncbi:hypothetical protein SY86_14740 [Erwinia tracheiphila]|uniref:Uncharacterized protein n=1 Tax=Erwinia tracheiphila TaxID=65700 RepID=A0A0M2KBU7_9GAMM|nr:hypothetical protein SY86_14740 [Erwinia tracheiphila]